MSKKDAVVVNSENVDEVIADLSAAVREGDERAAGFSFMGPSMPILVRGPDKVAHEWGEVDLQLTELERESKSVAKDYSDRLGLLKGRGKELGAELRAAERPVSFDYALGKKYTWDGRTGELLSTEDLPAGTQLDLPVRAPGDVFEGVEVGQAYRLARADELWTVTITAIADETIVTDSAGGSSRWTREEWAECKPVMLVIPTLEAGQAWKMPAEDPDGEQPIVQVTALTDGVVDVVWPGGAVGSIPSVNFIGAVLVPDYVPEVIEPKAKGKKKASK